MSGNGNECKPLIVGHICHAPLLVPFYPWAYSHKQHHRFHNHETKDMSHPWMTPERWGRAPDTHSRGVYDIIVLTQWLFRFPLAILVNVCT